MGLTYRAVVTIFALLIGSASAGTLDAAKSAAINKAAATFLALARDSAKTGHPPRQSDPTVKPLLDAVFDTSEIQSGLPLPMSALGGLQEWTVAVVKVGFVYLFAGTGLSGITSMPTDRNVISRIESNTIEFAPEIGRYMDATLRIEAAELDTVFGFVATASKVTLAGPHVKSGLAKIRAGVTRTIIGALTTMRDTGLGSSWRRDRMPALAAIAPKAAKLLLPEQIGSLRRTATEVAGEMTDVEIKESLKAFVAALAGH